MPTAVSDTEEPTGWIAFEVAGGASNFWLSTSNASTGILTDCGWDYPWTKDAPGPTDSNFSPLKSVSTKVERDYAGINSSGGPQVAGRADHSDIDIVKTADAISPILYQFVSTGEAFNRVFIVLRENDGTPRIEWLLEGVNLTHFGSNATKDWSDYYQYTSSRPLLESTSIDSNCMETYFYRNDSFGLLYTTAQMRVGYVTATQSIKTDWRGWDTGKNERIGDYPGSTTTLK